MFFKQLPFFFTKTLVIWQKPWYNKVAKPTELMLARAIFVFFKGITIPFYCHTHMEFVKMQTPTEYGIE